MQNAPMALLKANTVAKCTVNGWREGFVKLDEAWHIAQVFFWFLVGVGFLIYILYRALRG